MSRTVGRLNRAEMIVALAQRLHQSPRLLDGRADEVKSSTALPDSVIDLAALVVPGGSRGHEDEGLEEPVLVTVVSQRRCK